MTTKEKTLSEEPSPMGANITDGVEPAATWASDEASESMMQLKLGWLRMVAKCWREPAYADRVLKMTPQQIRNEFSTHYDVRLPTDLSVTIKRDLEQDIWDPDAKRWSFGTSAELALYLPNTPMPLEGKPARSDDGIALAEYEWNGRKYPFSCCC